MRAVILTAVAVYYALASASSAFAGEKVVAGCATAKTLRALAVEGKPSGKCSAFRQSTLGEPLGIGHVGDVPYARYCMRGYVFYITSTPDIDLAVVHNDGVVPGMRYDEPCDGKLAVS